MTHPLSDVPKPCPFCGSTDIHIGVESLDERSGYNKRATIGCCSTITIESTHDKNGWCNENLEPLKARAIAAWNKRKARKQ